MGWATKNQKFLEISGEPVRPVGDGSLQLVVEGGEPGPTQ